MILKQNYGERITIHLDTAYITKDYTQLIEIRILKNNNKQLKKEQTSVSYI